MERGLLELLGQVIEIWGVAVVGFADLAGCVGLGGLWVGDLGGRQGAALGDGFALGSWGGGLAGGGDFEDVEGAAGGGLLGGGLGGIVGDVVAVHDVLRRMLEQEGGERWGRTGDRRSTSIADRA